MNWAQFEELFLEKYFPEPVQQEMAQEFLSLKQGTMTVTQYASRFEALSRYVQGVVATEREKARRFEWGLEQTIRTQVIGTNIQTYTDLVDRALRIEREVNDTMKTDGQTSKDTQNSGGPIRNKKKGRFNKKPYNQGNNQQRTGGKDRKSTRLNSSHSRASRMPSSA